MDRKMYYSLTPTDLSTLNSTLFFKFGSEYSLFIESSRTDESLGHGNYRSVHPVCVPC
jgi:hypothetical protein